MAKVVSSQVSFAQVASGSVANQNTVNVSNDNIDVCKVIQESFAKFENILLKQSEQIGTLLNLLTAVISKLK